MSGVCVCSVLCVMEKDQKPRILCYHRSAMVRDFVSNTLVLFYSVATSIVPYVIKNIKDNPKKKSSHRSGVTLYRSTRNICRGLFGTILQEARSQMMAGPEWQTQEFPESWQVKVATLRSLSLTTSSSFSLYRLFSG